MKRDVSVTLLPPRALQSHDPGTYALVGLEAMAIPVDSAGEKISVHFRDRLTFSDHEDFGDVLAQIEASGAKAIVFDFANTKFIDSSALGMLLIAKDIAAQNGASITLKSANAEIKRLFDLGTFSEFFAIED